MREAYGLGQDKDKTQTSAWGWERQVEAVLTVIPSLSSGKQEFRNLTMCGGEGKLTGENRKQDLQKEAQRSVKHGGGRRTAWMQTYRRREEERERAQEARDDAVLGTVTRPGSELLHERLRRKVVPTGRALLEVRSRGLIVERRLLLHLFDGSIDCRDI